MAKKEPAKPTEPDAVPVAYEALLQAYQESLIKKLRGHTAGAGYLELWVPDEDPVKGLMNLVDAAQGGGRDKIAIAVSYQTLDRPSAEAFRQQASEIGTVVIEPSDTGLVLRVSGLQEGRKLPAARTSAARTVSASVLPVATTGSLTPAEATVVAAEELHPALERPLAEAARTISHEGEASSVPGLCRVEADSELGKLAVLIDPQDHRIRTARHRDANSATRRGILEVMCRLAEGRTVQDVSDHIGILALHALCHGARPVPGILLPRNAGAGFVACLDLFRSVRARYADLSGQRSTANFFETPPSPSWAAMPSAAKLSAARAVADGVAGDRGLAPGSILVERIEKDILGFEVRAVASLTDDIAPADKPIVARALEHELKERVEAKLQVHLEPRRDRNKLRRLQGESPGPGAGVS